jgi:hypothetical protein
LGGDLMYWCLAMGSPFPNELRAELLPAFLKSNVPQNVVLPHSTRPLLDRVVPSGLPASDRSGVFRKTWKTGPSQRKQRGYSDERKNP